MEYFIGPLVALVIGIKYTDFKNKLNTSKVQALQEDVVARIEKMEVNVADVDKEILKKSLKLKFRMRTYQEIPQLKHSS